MKRPNIQLILALVLAGTSGALAQSGGTVPGPSDYSDFSRFITDRNIFDPNRQPHSGPRPVVSTHTRSISAPAFSLVGVMMYNKGLFAFFNGNSDELRRALSVDGQIAGYTVADIAYNQVTLQSTNQSEKVELKVGDGMREENGRWQLAAAGDLAIENPAGPARSSEASDASPPPSLSSGPASDILKRLMEKRKEENQ